MTSDEGRCQKTAAHFLKGFLAQEDDIAPIMSSLLSRDENAIRLLDKVIHTKEMEHLEKEIKDQVEPRRGSYYYMLLPELEI